MKIRNENVIIENSNIEMVLTKNGPRNVIFHLWSIDKEKPKVEYKDGKYHFNREHIISVPITEEQLYNRVLGL